MVKYEYRIEFGQSFSVYAAKKNVRILIYCLIINWEMRTSGGFFGRLATWKVAYRNSHFRPENRNIKRPQGVEFFWNCVPRDISSTARKTEEKIIRSENACAG